MLFSYFLQRYSFTTLSLCFSSNVLNAAFHCGFPGAKLTVSWFTLNPGLFPHLIAGGLVCVFRFHLPTNHSHTSPVDKAIHSAAQQVPGVHLGSKQRQAQGQRETDEDFYFPWNDKLFCLDGISHKCTTFRLLANIIYGHCGVFIVECYFLISRPGCSLIPCPVPSRIIQFPLPTNHYNKRILPEEPKMWWYSDCNLLIA